MAPIISPTGMVRLLLLTSSDPSAHSTTMPRRSDATSTCALMSEAARTMKGLRMMSIPTRETMSTGMGPSSVSRSAMDITSIQSPDSIATR